jgi:glutamyl/glutaminyl-tRNA synthetase
MYRILNQSHHRTGTDGVFTYVIMRMGSQTVGKITHSICTLELIHRPYDWFMEELRDGNYRQGK